MAASFQTRELLYIAPEIFLATWGLLVLIVDFALLRKSASPRRARILGILSLVGAFLTILLGIQALLPPGSGSFPPIGNLALELSAQDYSLFAGTLAADPMTAIFNIVLAALLMLVIGISMTWGFTEHWGEYFALLIWAGVGMMFLIAAEELLTLFLTLETMTLCLYMMAAFEKTKRRSAEAGLKYFVYGSVSSALFLFGLSLLYGLAGSTRFDAIRVAIGSIGTSGLENNIAAATALLLILVGFGFKIAAVPFQQWAPDTYEGAPAPVAAWVAAGSKIASFVALMKVLLVALPIWAYNRADQSAGEGNLATPGWIGVIAVISAISMTYGNFAALAQKNFKRMLAYSSIAHAGYMLVGVLAAAISVNRAAAAGAVLFYLLVYGFTTVGAFAVAAWLARDRGSDDIADLNGLGSRSPALGVCIVLLMLSLIGMPPLGGFFGKFYMFMEAMNTGKTVAPQAWVTRQTLTWLVALGLFNSVVSAFYYVRVLKAMFLRPEQGQPLAPAVAGVAAPILLSTLVAVGLGLYPGPMVELMKGAALAMLQQGTPRNNPIATQIMPDKIITPEQRGELRRIQEEEDRKRAAAQPKGTPKGNAGGGGGGGGGGGMPKKYWVGTPDPNEPKPADTSKTPKPVETPKAKDSPKAKDAPKAPAAPASPAPPK